MSTASEDTASPCVRNCCLADDNVCLGCGRTLAEIVRWSNAGDGEKREILAKSRARMDKTSKLLE